MRHRLGCPADPRFTAAPKTGKANPLRGWPLSIRYEATRPTLETPDLRMGYYSFAAPPRRQCMLACKSFIFSYLRHWLFSAASTFLDPPFQAHWPQKNKET